MTTPEKLLECENEDGDIDFNVLITTYEIVVKDNDFFEDIVWSNIVVEGAQELTNEDSLLYKVFGKIESHHRLVLTGNLSFGGLKEFWCVTKFLQNEETEIWMSLENQKSLKISEIRTSNLI